MYNYKTLRTGWFQRKRAASLIIPGFPKHACLFGGRFLFCGLSRPFIIMYRSLTPYLGNMKEGITGDI